jgi:phospholipase/lecithinase/hemolysin
MANSYASTASSIAAVAQTVLFVVWGGANDFLSPSPLDITPMGVDNLAVADRAANNLVSLVNALTGFGAKHILVPGLPDLGLTPVFQSQGPAVAAQASALTDYFNFKVASSLASDVTYFDTAGLLRAVVANPGAYGFTNVTTRVSISMWVRCARLRIPICFGTSSTPQRGRTRFWANSFSRQETGTLPMVIAACGLLLAARCTAKRTSRRWV